MSTNPPKPNFLFIITHDTGRYLHCYGATVPTPHIGRIANNGVRFAHHYCTAPQCSPSRGAILTGRYPHENGLMGLTNYGWDLPEHNGTLPTIFNQHGYTTQLIGLQHEHREARQLGYARISPRSDFPFYGQSILPRIQDFFQDIEKGVISQPFFCSVGLFETHRPFFASEEEEVTHPL